MVESSLQTSSIPKKGKIQENFVSMKSAKIQCNRVIAEAKKSHWTEFCKREVLNLKTGIKYGKKLKK